MAHFDTGCSITSIDIKLAHELELIPIGTSVSQTAGGLRDAKNYMVDISFPNTGLKGYRLKITDCVLAYDDTAPELDPTKFGVLIGRDIMMNWNIFWSGPTSSVFISD
jgi:hypothetical protein